MGRKTNTDQRREQIVLAFMRVVASNGYSGSSIQEIAKAAELSPGLIHYHFKSKQEILITLFSHLESLINDRMAARNNQLNKAEPPTAKNAMNAIDALIEAFLSLDASSDQLAVKCWTMISAEAVYNQELSQEYRRVLRKQLALIEKLSMQAFDSTKSAAKKMDKRKIRANAAAILAAIHGSFLLASAAPGLIPTGSAASSIKLMARSLIQED
jgi:TetR/AcrR family transcriptional repressor of bet genes